MQTFKKLGCKMTRNEKGGWRIANYDRGLSFEGQGNKGTVMADALASWKAQGAVVFTKGKGWTYVR